MPLPDVSAQALRAALARFDAEFRGAAEYADWEDNLAYKFAVDVDGKRYPVKKVISIATGVPTASFSGGTGANDYLAQRGLSIVELHSNAIHDGLESILENYSRARTSETFGAQAPIARAFDRMRRLLSSSDILERFTTVKVKASYGQGNWAKVPWIAFLDSRETASTQKGVYPVILIRQDCSGLYVTFNQGVTEPQGRLGTQGGLEELRNKAKQIRSEAAGQALAAAGYQLDDGIDLKADPGLGRDYEASTIGYKFYGKGELPADAEIIRDVQAVLNAYSTYLASPITAPDDPVVHLLLKWSAKETPDTIDRHKRIADEKGAVWWGKFGDVGMSPGRFSQIRRQLERGLVTKVFLKGGNSLWETTLQNITQTTTDVDIARLPTYYTADKCKLFLLVSDFRPVTIEWFTSNAVSDSNPLPGSVRDLLNSQGSPAYVRLSSDAALGLPICLIGSSKADWVATATATINREGSWASWWSFPIKPEARAQLVTPFDLYINSGGGTFPLKLTIAEYETSQGSAGLISPWPNITDKEEVGETRAGDAQNLIFKTWFRVSALTLINPPLHLDNFQPVPGLSAVNSLLSPTTFGYARLIAPQGMTMDDLVKRTLLDKQVLEEILGAVKGRQVVLAGPPGTGKTFIAKCIAEYMCQRVSESYRLVQFHPSYSYESFIQGLRPTAGPNGITFQLQDGIVLEVTAAMRTRGHVGDTSPPYVVVIDEMNRANLPRVFGELMFLFEYRNEAMRLQYSDTPFTMPPNLSFIGTMNTADKSIRSLDSALRRRFDVFEFPPSTKILERFFATVPLRVPNLVAGFEALNAELKKKIDRHHAIGHAFFMHSGLDYSQLSAIWRRKIYPLIEEYFFDEPDVAPTFTVEKFWPVIPG